jgi:hypothetical protein
MIQTFREWLKEKETKEIDFKEASESVGLFESFNTHYDIQKIYYNGDFLFYEFLIRDMKYRVFIEYMGDYDMIHIGFEKYNEESWNWRIKGIDDELKNGEIQKLFGTIIYVVKELYKKQYNNILFGSDEDKKFRVYLRLVSQISNELIPNSSVSHDERKIIIHKNVKSKINLSKIVTKYKPKK